MLEEEEEEEEEVEVEEGKEEVSVFGLLNHCICWKMWQTAR
jgi:hypothetical protein